MPADAPRAPAAWSLLVCLLTGLLAAAAGAVHDVFPRGDLTPAAFVSVRGAVAPLLERAVIVGAWYIWALAAFGAAALALRANLAGAAAAAGAVTLVAARGGQPGLATALLSGAAPVAAYFVARRLASSRELRRLTLVLLTLGTLLPLEVFFLYRWIELDPTPPSPFAAFGWRLRVSIACLTTAAACGMLLPTRWARLVSAASGAAVLAAAGVGLWISGDEAAAVVEGSTSGPRHVVWLTADTLRADAVSFETPSATPALAALARDATVFSSAVSPAPWTLPALTSLITGFDPAVHGVGLGPADLQLPTVAEYFADAGRRTAFFIGNPILMPGAALHDTRNQPRFGFYRGVDDRRIFHDRRYGGSRGADSLYARDPERWFDGGATAEQTDYVVDWLSRRADEPFFLWTHYYDPHWPFAPPGEYRPGREPPAGLEPRVLDAREVRLGTIASNPVRQDWMRALYAAEVRWVDRALGRILDRLVELGLYDDALIVVTSDHGEEFWEHRRFGHGHALYEETLRVPLIIKPPGGGARVVDERVSTLSVLPTTLNFADIPHQAAPGWSPSLADAVRGQGAVSPMPVFASGVELFENQETVFFEGLQLIRCVVSGDVELYDLAADPKAQRSIAGERPGAVARGMELLDRRRAEALRTRRSHGLGVGDQAEDPALLERLKDLGYL